MAFDADGGCAVLAARGGSGCLALCAAVVACVLSVGVPTSSTAAESPPPSVSVLATKDPMMLERLRVPDTKGLRRVFELGADEKEDKGWWYLVRFSARLRSTARSGSLTLSAWVNGRAAIQVLIDVGSSTRCGGREISWEALDLVYGRVTRRACGSEAQIFSENFVQIGTIKPGPSTFDVHLSGAPTDKTNATLLAGSGLIKSRYGPARINFDTPPSPELAGGRWSKLRIGLVNQGARPARQVAAVATPEEGKVKPRRLKVPAVIESKGHAETFVWVRPTDEGRLRIRFSAEASSNQTSVVLENDWGPGPAGEQSPVGSQSRSGTDPESGALIIFVSGMAGLIGLGVWSAVERRRKARSSPQTRRPAAP
jgi:hypothetical protein